MTLFATRRRLGAHQGADHHLCPAVVRDSPAGSDTLSSICNRDDKSDSMKAAREYDLQQATASAFGQNDLYHFDGSFEIEKKFLRGRIADCEDNFPCKGCNWLEVLPNTTA
jgi:hypothetical protein